MSYMFFIYAVVLRVGVVLYLLRVVRQPGVRSVIEDGNRGFH